MPYKNFNTLFNHRLEFCKLCYDNFIAYEFLNFFLNVFKSKTIEIFHTLIIHMKSYPISSS